MGDSFLKEAYNSLQTLKSSAKKKKIPPPHIYQQYNVDAFWPKLTTKGINRFLNPLIEAMNQEGNEKLPKLLVIIPDKDFLHALKKKKVETALVMGSSIYNLIKHLDITINRRCNDLQKKKPGAIIQNFPKIIWVRMPRRPPIGYQPNEKLFSMRPKFNSILEERLLDGEEDRHRIVSIEISLEEYDLWGNMTPDGKSNFWRELDRAIRKFDDGKITLRPRKTQPPPKKPKNSSDYNNSSFNFSAGRFVSSVFKKHAEWKKNHRKLPSPPVNRRPAKPSHSSHHNRSRSRSTSRHSRTRRSRTRSNSRSRSKKREHKYHDHNNLHHHKEGRR